MNTVRLRELEGLRGLLAWWVVVGHILYVFSDRLGELSMNGSAVTVFIVLSGFVITNLLVTAQEPYLPFIIRRFWRLWPVMIVVLVASVITLHLQAEAFSANPFAGSARNDQRLTLIAAALRHPFAHFVAHATMLHGLLPNSILWNAGLTMIGQAWSIALEWQFYLVAPFIVALIRRNVAGVLAAAAIGAALIAIDQLTVMGTNSGFLGRGAPWFAVGIASYFAWTQRDDRNTKVAVCIGAIALAVYGVLSPEPGAVVWAIMMLTMCGMLGRLGTGIAAILTWQPLKRLGDISYSTYMIHMLILTMVMRVVSTFTADPVAYGTIVVAGCVVLTCVASAASYRWIERPGIRLGSYFAATFRKPVAAPQAPSAIPVNPA